MCVLIACSYTELEIGIGVLFPVVVNQVPFMAAVEQYSSSQADGKKPFATIYINVN